MDPDAADPGPAGEKKVAAVEDVTDQMKGLRIRTAERFYNL
jgi:hypothetical protein